MAAYFTAQGFMAQTTATPHPAGTATSSHLQPLPTPCDVPSPSHTTPPPQAHGLSSSPAPSSISSAVAPSRAEVSSPSPSSLLETRPRILCAQQACGGQFQSDGHVYCAMHSSCNDNGMFNPENCSVCHIWVEALLQQRSIGSIDKASDPFILLHKRWTNFLKSRNARVKGVVWWSNPQLALDIELRSRPWPNARPKSSSLLQDSEFIPPPSVIPHGTASEASFEGFSGPPGDASQYSIPHEVDMSDEERVRLPSVDAKWCQVRPTQLVHKVDGKLMVGELSPHGGFIPDKSIEVIEARCPSRGVGLYFRFTKGTGLQPFPSLDRVNAAMNLVQFATGTPRAVYAPASSQSSAHLTLPETDVPDPQSFHRTLKKGWEKLISANRGEEPSFAHSSAPKYQVRFGEGSSLDHVQAFLTAPPLSEAPMPAGLQPLRDSASKQDAKSRNKAMALSSALAITSGVDLMLSNVAHRKSFDADPEAFFTAWRDINRALQAFVQSAFTDALGTCAKSRLYCRRKVSDKIKERHSRVMIQSDPWSADIMPREEVSEALASMPHQVVVQVKQPGHQSQGGKKQMFSPPKHQHQSSQFKPKSPQPSGSGRGRKQFSSQSSKSQSFREGDKDRRQGFSHNKGQFKGKKPQ